MEAQFRQLLTQLQLHQDQLVIAYFYLIVFSWKFEKVRRISSSTALVGTAAALAVLTIVTYGVTIIFYLLYPNYLDHMEPLVASISWEWMHGHVLYPNWTTGDAWISIFGPLLFLINGLPLLLGPSIFSTKLVGVLFLTLALIAILIALKQTTGSNLRSLVLLASLVGLFEIFPGYPSTYQYPYYQLPYWNRPEPFLITTSVLALVVIAWKPPPLLAGISIGVLAGLATGLKLHSFIYLIPAAALTVTRIKSLRGQFVVAIISGIVAAIFALLFYLANGVSIVGYLRFLRVAFQEHWSGFRFIENVQAFFVLTAALVVPWIWRKQTFEYSERWFFAGLFISAATIVVIGAKVGAGSYYLLPLVPAFIYGIAIGCPRSATEAGGITALISIAIFLAYGPNLWFDMQTAKYLYQVKAPEEGDKIAELQNYISSYSDAQIGISDDEHYPSYYYQVLSVWNGHPLRVSFTAWMDLAYVGVDEKYITRFVERCAVKTWILPVGNPFMQTNWYNNLPIVTDNFRRIFFANYRQIELGNAYQVWRCNQ
jgi:hypothetical protein